MPSSVLFRLGPDPVLTDVMAAFVDLSRRPFPGQITVEELLLHLLAQPDTQALCKAHQVNLAQLSEDAEQALFEAVQGLAAQTDEPEYPIPLPLGEFPQRTEAFEAVVIAAITQAQGRATAAVGVLDFLAAISQLPRTQSPASRVLQDHGLSHRLLLTHAMRQDDHNPYAPRLAPGQVTPVADSNSDPVRERFLYDVSAEAQDWHERQHLVEEGLRLLASARQPHLMLMGPPASGKANLAAELARRLTHGPRPAGLEHTRILGLNLDALAAGCQLRSQMEERIRKYVVEIIERKKATREAVVLWVGDIGQALTYARKDLDIFMALRLAIRHGYVRLMGSATPEQFKRLQDHDADLAAAFVPLQVKAPSTADAQAIVRRHLQGFADHHQVDYPEALLARGQTLVARYLPHRPPVAALLQVFDEAGVHARQRHTTQVSEEDLSIALARQVQVDPSVILGGDGAQIQRVQAHLTTHLVGQAHAVEVLIDSLSRAAVGLGEGGQTRPVGSFIFAGPTGVGKTEMARRLAEGMGVPLVTLDMSEYSESHTVSRLIGSPPGYLGHQEVPVLARALDQSPRAVILVDEVEKAAREVHMLFLQILDRGSLTDGKGQVMDFRQCILIFTSNLGAQDATRSSIGFLHDPNGADDRREAALSRGFPPEFRNRLDHIVQFRALSRTDMAGVVDRRLARLAQQLAERGHRVKFTPTLRAHLAEHGYDPAYGARPLQRLIDQEVSKPLTRAILARSTPLQAQVGYRKGQVQVTARA